MNLIGEIQRMISSGPKRLTDIADALSGITNVANPASDTQVRRMARRTNCSEVSGGVLGFKPAGQVYCADCPLYLLSSCQVPDNIIPHSRRIVDITERSSNDSRGSNLFSAGRRLQPGELSKVSGLPAKFLQ